MIGDPATIGVACSIMRILVEEDLIFLDGIDKGICYHI